MNIESSITAERRAGSEGTAWHALPVEEVFSQLIAAPAGLSSAEASRRLAQHGPNKLLAAKPVRPILVFARQFKSILISILLAAAIASAFLSDWLDSAAIFAIVLLNACVGAYQELTAEHSIAALKRLEAPQARVRRDDKIASISAADTVVGDVIVLEAGDMVPADARLFETVSLTCVEAALTGESESISKRTGPVPDSAALLADRDNIVFMGTLIAAGAGQAVVTATGMRTEIGRIAELVETTQTEPTPLQQRVHELGKVILWAALGIILLLVAICFSRGLPVLEVVMTAVSLAVAAIPEGLPAVVTVALALGVTRMVKRRALVRTLPSVETLGCTSVICTDKTGTLTVGEMTARELFVANKLFHVTGEGYAPSGEVLFEGEVSDARHAAHLLELATALVGSNNAHLSFSDGHWSVIGDPTEGALLTVGHKAGARREHIEMALPRHHEIPFDSDRKRRTVVRLAENSRLRAFVTGAPDLLLEQCTRLYTAEGVRFLTHEDRKRVTSVNTSMAGRALRVLGSAYRDLDKRSAKHLTPAELERDLVFVGLAGMQDPARPEAKQAVAQCHDAGIRVIMITGDHPATALAIARELSIARSVEEVMTGAELGQVSDEQLRARAPHVSVYARVTAEHKLRIVRAWKENGAVVAMTGDGVNDAPALKGADIGIAMGRTGTEVTKQAADLIVTDDNFATIVSAVEEGRGIYDNIRKTLQYLLASNAGELVLMAGTAAAGLPLPLLPIHLLWINLLTDGPPALCLAADPIEPGLLARPPRDPKERMVTKAFLRRIGLAGLICAAVAFVVFVTGLDSRGVEVARARAFAVLVFSQLLLAFSMRSDTRNAWELRPGWKLVVVVFGLIGAQLISQCVPVISGLLKTPPLALGEAAVLLVAGAIPMVLLEAIKFCSLRRKHAKQRAESFRDKRLKTRDESLNRDSQH